MDDLLAWLLIVLGLIGVASLAAVLVFAFGCMIKVIDRMGKGDDDDGSNKG